MTEAISVMYYFPPGFYHWCCLFPHLSWCKYSSLPETCRAAIPLLSNQINEWWRKRILSSFSWLLVILEQLCDICVEMDWAWYHLSTLPHSHSKIESLSVAHKRKEGTREGIRKKRRREKRFPKHRNPHAETQVLTPVEGSLLPGGESGSHCYHRGSSGGDGPLLSMDQMLLLATLHLIHNINPSPRVWAGDGEAPFSREQILWIELHCSRATQSLSILGWLAGHFCCTAQIKTINLVPAQSSGPRGVGVIQRKSVSIPAGESHSIRALNTSSINRTWRKDGETIPSPKMTIKIK